MNRRLMLILIAAVMVLASVSAALAYQISGQTAFINDTKAYISATPHTITGPGYVTVEFQSKLVDLDATAVFGYNGAYLKPRSLEYWNPHNETVTRSYRCAGEYTTTNNPQRFTCAHNGTLVFEHEYTADDAQAKTASWEEIVENNWSVVPGNINKLGFAYDGKNQWHYIPNIPLKKGVLYRARVWIDAPYTQIGKRQAELYPDYDGKYDIAFFPSAYGSNIPRAIADGNFYLLDPAVNLNDGVLGFWALNETSAPMANSVNGGPAVTQNTLVAIANGPPISNRSWGYSTLTSNAGRISNTYPALRNYTVSLWLNQTSICQSQAYRILTRSVNAGVDLYTDTPSGTIYLAGGGVSASVGCGRNIWRMITAGYNGTHYFLAVNGTIVNTSAGAAPTDSANGMIYISTYDGGSQGIAGTYAQIGLWSRALNPDEITALYNGGQGLAYPFSTGNPNASPVIGPVNISPSVAYTGTALTGACSATDPNGNAMSYRYQWFLNTVLRAENGTSVAGANVSKGQSWIFSCQVNNTVGNATAWTNSSALVISNTAPTNNWNGSNYTYNHNATGTMLPSQCADVDPGETMTYTSNDSQFLMQANGSAQLNLSLSRIGRYAINVTCSDGTNSTSRTTWLNVTNNPPVITGGNLSPNPVPLATEYLTLVINCTDPDGDGCMVDGSTTSWRVNGAEYHAGGVLLYRSNWTAQNSSTIYTQFRATDEQAFSSYANTSTVTTGDGTVPNLSTVWFTPDPMTAGSQGTISANCTDLNPLNVTLQITDGAGVKANHTPAASGSTYSYNYTPPEAGTYFAQFFCKDTANYTSISQDTTFTVGAASQPNETEPSTGGGGGGGGGSTTIINYANGTAPYELESPIVDKGILWMTNFGENPVRFDVTVRASRLTKGCIADRPFNCSIIDNGTAIVISLVEPSHDFLSKTVKGQIKVTSDKGEVASTAATFRIINLGYAIGGETERAAPEFFEAFPYIIRVTYGNIHGVRLVALLATGLVLLGFVAAWSMISSRRRR